MLRLRKRQNRQRDAADRLDRWLYQREAWHIFQFDQFDQFDRFNYEVQFGFCAIGQGNDAAQMR